MSDDTESKAIALARQGLRVFPCLPDKRPTIKDWPHLATDSSDLIRQWSWRNRLIGVRMGVQPSGDVIACIDIDIKDPVDGKGGAYGDKWALANADRLPRTRMHVTWSGGFHLLFRCRDGEVVRNTAGKKIAPGIDVRGEGGFIIWWPAKGCAVLHDVPLDRLAIWPEWVLSDCDRGSERLDGRFGVSLKPAENLVYSNPSDSSGSSAGAFRETRIYALAALRHAGHRVSTASNGERNATLNIECFSIARFVMEGTLSQDEVAATMATAARLAGLNEQETAATIASALNGRRRVP
jgi:hypothetical protein